MGVVRLRDGGEVALEQRLLVGLREERLREALVTLEEVLLRAQLGLLGLGDVVRPGLLLAVLLLRFGLLRVLGRLARGLLFVELRLLGVQLAAEDLGEKLVLDALAP